jgi:outer membrane protein OmpA-like peptidoglycan-associated protein
MFQFEHLNLKLSKDRAAAVAGALVARDGITSWRLKAHGAGSLAPVASNDSEEGKQLNRPVELVKQ